MATFAEKGPRAWSGETIALLADDIEADSIARLVRAEGFEPLRLEGIELVESVTTVGLAAAVIAEGALSPRNAGTLIDALANQPRWIDLPILLVTDRSALAADCALLRQIDQLRIVERPIEPTFFSAALRGAIRSRANQRAALAFTEQALATERQQTMSLKELSERLANEVEERRQAEVRLSEREELYRYTIELSQQLVWTLDAEGKLVGANTRFYEWTGSEPTRPVTEIFRELLHPDDLRNWDSRWVETIQSGEPFRIEFRLRVSDGSYRVFATRAAPRRDDAGVIVRWYGLTEDVTEQKLAMAALHQAEERYRLAARATNDAIWDWNLSTGEVEWNEAAHAYRGVAKAGQSSIQWWENAIHSDDRQRVQRSIRAAISGDKSRWSAAYRVRKADGDYAYVYDRGFIIRDEDGNAVRAVGAVVDLTERRRAEAELRRTQAELIHVSRLSAMGTMASTLAHELNQPLTAVTSYVRGSRRLLDGMNEPGAVQVREALEHAEAGALRAGQIVRRLRELVARGSVAVGPEDLEKLIEDACILAFVDAHLHDVSHRIHIDRAARWVEVDRIQIQQVLINLVRNAVQALREAKRREILISAKLHSDGMIEVSVADSGAGISESVRDALFSPFHSTKSEGLGIGLSISRTIVEAHHGRIWAEDGQDGGAVFRFTVPRAELVLEEQQQLEMAALQVNRPSTV